MEKDGTIPLIPPLPSGEEKRPFWSVMIPCYRPNREHLRAALQSVLAAEISPTEMQIEVLNDGPAEELEEFVAEIGDGRIRFSSTPRNLGLAGSWNECLQRSLGEWIHLLHQDDLVRPEFYSTLRRMISSSPEAGAAFSRTDYIGPSGVKFCENLVLQPDAGLLANAVEVLARRNEIQCAGIVVRRAVYESLGGYDSQFAFALDWEMWVRIAAHFPVLYHPEILASFRVAENSETSRLAQIGENVHDCMRTIGSFARYLPIPRATGVQAQARDWACDIALQKAEGFYLEGKSVQAMAQLRAALAYDNRWSSWRKAFRFWTSSMRNSRRFIPPPLPGLFQAMNGESKMRSPV